MYAIKNWIWIEREIHRIPIDEREWELEWWTSANCSIPPGESNLNAEWIGISMCAAVCCLSVCDSTFTIHSIKWPSQLMIWTIWKDDTRTTHFKLNKYHTSKYCCGCAMCVEMFKIKLRLIAFSMYRICYSTSIWCCVGRSIACLRMALTFQFIWYSQSVLKPFYKFKEHHSKCNLFFNTFMSFKRIEKQMQKQPAASQSQSQTAQKFLTHAH